MALKAKTSPNRHRSHTVDQAIAEATKDKIVKLNINISKKKRTAFKVKTVANGDTMQDILLEAIDKYLET